MDFTFSPAQRELADRATAAGQEFRKHANEWDVSNYASFEEVTGRMGELGLLGITMPEQYGGLGLTALDYAIVVEKCMTAATTPIAVEPTFRTAGPGPMMCLMSPNDRIRDKYMADVVAGRHGVAIAITEPDYGSDMSSLASTAVRDGDEWVINGSKAYITGAVEESLYATFVRFDGIRGAKGIGAILVERGTPGFEMQRGPTFVGSRGMPHGDLQFHDVRVPAESLLFGPGEFKLLMKAFNIERLHNAACSVAGAQAAFDEALAYTQTRRQFDREIIEFQAVYHDFADMWTKIESARYLAYRAAANAADGILPEPLEVSVAKYVANDAMFDVSARCVTLQGAFGTTYESSAQRIHRDAMATRVAGGSTQVLRNVIASQLMPDRRFSQRRAEP